MDARTPPLNALKVFEAAARLRSFKKAAEELHVTPTAVSHRVTQLEDVLGMSLFVRDAHGVELTPAARACLPTLQRGLDNVRDFVAQLKLHPQSEIITVRTSPSFSMRWLMPRLHRFIVGHPGVDVYVDTYARLFMELRPGDARSGLPDAGGDEADITLIYGAGNVPGLLTERLLDAAVTPLCSPALLARHPPLTSPDQLDAFTPLHCDRDAIYGERSLWQLWLDAAGAGHIRTDHGLRFTQASLAIEAAVDNMGIVMCFPVLAAAELEAGKLVAPFDLTIPLASGYQLISSKAANRRPAVMAFKRWLHAEADATRLADRTRWATRAPAPATTRAT